MKRKRKKHYMTDKIILTDADGCLLNWVAEFNLFMHEKGLPLIPDAEDNYSIAKRHGCTHEAGRELVLEFNHSPYIRDLHPFADSRKYVNMLHGQGFEFVVISSLSDSKQSHNNRLHNLRKHFGGAIKELHCLPIGDPKKDILEEWKDSNLFWIEDHVENAADGANLGLRSIVIDHPYNTKYTLHDHQLYARVGYARPWKEIYDLITKAYGIENMDNVLEQTAL